MRRHWDAIAVATFAVALTAPVLFALDAPLWLRAPVVLLLVCVAPGVALVRLGGSGDLLSTTVLAIAVSLSLAVVVSLTLLYLNSWSLLLSLILLAAVALVATSVRPLVIREEAT